MTSGIQSSLFMSVRCHMTSCDERFLLLSGSVGQPSILCTLEIVNVPLVLMYALCV